MRALELSLRNYRVFEEVDLELPARVIGIFGENGAGKTTLLESLAFALFGVDATRTKKDQVRTHGVLADCEVRLVFEHAGQPYEVRRALKGRGSAPEAELYAGDLQLASGVTEVDEEVARLLHMDLRVFRASVYAEQKQLDAFSEVTAGKRKEMALRLLGIRPVDDARTAARRESRASIASAEQLAGAVADTAEIEAELKAAKDVVVEAKAAAKIAAAELRSATAQAKAATTAFQKVDAARQKAEKILVELRVKTEERVGLVERSEEATARVESIAAALAAAPALEEELKLLQGADDRRRAGESLVAAAKKLSALKREITSIPEAVVALDALDEMRAAQRDAEQGAVEAATRARHAREAVVAAESRLDRTADADPTEPCPTCGQPLGASFAGYVKHLKSELASARKEAASLEKVAREREGTSKKAEAAAEKAARLVETERERSERRARLVAQAQELLADVAPLREAFGDGEPDIRELRAAEQRLREVEKLVAGLEGQRAHLATAEEDSRKIIARLGDLDAKLAGLAEQAESVAFDAEQHAALRSALEEADDVLTATREAERSSADALAAADKVAAALGARLEEAKALEAKVGDLRSDARYLERTVLLLDGFRDHLVARVGPELSHEAEVIFRELTNHEYDDLRVNEETLAIEIADGDGYFPIERFSGSETDLANLALRVAISTHLSRVSGADLGMLVLDEVLASLDAERKDLMVQTLGRLAGRFHQVFVITHAEQVKDQFPASIEVRKTSRRRSIAALV